MGENAGMKIEWKKATSLREDSKISKKDLLLWIMKFNNNDEWFEKETQELRQNLNFSFTTKESQFQICLFKYY